MSAVKTPRFSRVMSNGKITLPPDYPRHGSEAGYAAGCRQECCRVAHRLYSRKKKQERIARGIPEHVHGTRTGYVNWDCRCDRCKVAMVGKP